MSIEGIGRDDVLALWFASLAGPSHVAHQLERLNLSSRDESLETARVMIPVILQAVEDAMEDVRRDDRS